jgi:hypothetical protein
MFSSGLNVARVTSSTGIELDVDVDVGAEGTGAGGVDAVVVPPPPPPPEHATAARLTAIQPRRISDDISFIVLVFLALRLRDPIDP